MLSLIKKIKKKFATQNPTHNDHKKLNAIVSQLSHDLKGNLVAIRTSAKNILHYTSHNNLEANMDRIEKALSGIDIKVNHSMTILNMITLFSMENGKLPDDVTYFSMKDCIQQAIHSYPFASSKHASSVQFSNSSADFLMNGNKTLMMGIFYCLIKNGVAALYAVGESGAIIFIEPNENQNRVHFKFHQSNNIDQPAKHDLFALGTPNNIGQGLNFIVNVIQGMNGSVEFYQGLDNSLNIALIFK